MADEANSVVASDNPDPGTASDAPMSAREGDEAIAALLGNLGTDNPESESEADVSDAEPEHPTEDQPDETTETPEDVEANPDEPDDKPDDYASGRFAADTAKVKLEDGTVASIAELKNGVLLQRDYTRKTMELANHRKEVEAFATELSQSNERLAKEREVLREFAVATMPQPPQMPTESADVNPMAWAQYAQNKAQYENLVEWHNYLEAGKQQEAEQRAELERRRIEEVTRHAHAQIAQTFKLTDEAKATAFWDDIGSKAAKHYGVSKDDVRKLTDVKVLSILRDALAHREAIAKSAQTQQVVAGKPPMVNGSGRRQNPGTAVQRARQGSVERLRQTGSTRDADAAILAFLK